MSVHPVTPILIIMNITAKLFVVACIVLPFTCFGAPEQPVDTTVCELASNPDAFNHKLVKLSGEITRGYKVFTLNAACKPNLSSIWLDYGGFINAPSVFNSQQRDTPRSQQLTIEGLPTTLVDDTPFRKFNTLISSMSDNPQVNATLIGRYFAGRPEQIGEFKLWKGFGPLQCCTLLVIQQVVEVKPNDQR